MKRSNFIKTLLLSLAGIFTFKKPDGCTITREIIKRNWPDYYATDIREKSFKISKTLGGEPIELQTSTYADQIAQMGGVITYYPLDEKKGDIARNKIT